MADADTRVRVEIAFDGGQIMVAQVEEQTAEALERALAEGSEAAFALESEDGRYTVVTRRVVYVKRHRRESRLGFGA